MKSKPFLLLTFLLGLGVFVFIFDRYGSSALALLSRDFSIGLLVAFILMGAATLCCLGWRWKALLAGLTRAPGVVVLTLYRSAAHSLATIIPSGKIGGDPLRAWLAVRGKVPAGSAIASVAVDRTLEIATTAPFSLAFAAILVSQGVPRLEEVMLTMSVATLGLLFGIALALRRIRRGSGLVTALVENMKVDRFEFIRSRVEVIEDSEQKTAQLSRDGARLRKCFLAGLLANVLVIGEFALLLRAFGLPADPVAVVAALFATGAAHLLPVPAGIGVLEGALIWIFGVLGYPADVGLAVALVARLREFLWMLPGLAYASVQWFHALATHSRLPRV